VLLARRVGPTARSSVIGATNRRLGFVGIFPPGIRILLVDELLSEQSSYSSEQHGQLISAQQRIVFCVSFESLLLAVACRSQVAACDPLRIWTRARCELSNRLMYP